MSQPLDPCPCPGSPREVFLAFLKLGLSAFGGPVAHLGYFRTEFVERRRWLDDQAYADLVALCQFLPGPASSQVGMALGLGRAGWWGALAAWLGFTLPSAIALVLFAQSLALWSGRWQAGVLHGLQVLAVAVVAQALWSMSRALCPDRLRLGLALGSAMLVLGWSSPWSQLLAMVWGGVMAWWLLSLAPAARGAERALGVGSAAGTRLLVVFGLLLLGLPLLAQFTGSPLWSMVAGVYQAGALVFGGGHVVLPLLQTVVVPTGLIDGDTFVAGYGAAQAIPGPLFSFAAFLGAALPAPWGGWPGGALMLVAIFLPSFLLLAGALPHWQALRQHGAVQRAMAGVNAAVVGLLGAALYDPVGTSAIHSLWDAVAAVLAFGLLVIGRWPPVWVVAAAALLGGLLAA